VFAAAVTVAATGNTAISHDADRQQWVIGNDRIQLLVTAPEGGEFQLQRLALPKTGQAWSITADADAVLTIDGQPRRIGREMDGFRVDTVSGSSVHNGVQLDVRMVLAELELIVTRHYVLYDGSPTVELWTTVAAAANTTPHALKDLNALALVVPLGTVRWMTGLQNDNAVDQHDTAFTLQRRDLSDGQTMTLSAKGRASERVMPYAIVEGDRQSFFAGIMWSGGWRLAIARKGGAITLTGGLASMSTTLHPGRAVEGPHAFFGVTPHGTSEVTKALHSFVLNGVRGGRPFEPLVTYNTWYAHGTRFDERDLQREMQFAAAVGAELFVADAGWHVGAGQRGVYDFESGLGNWTPDPARFPSGLRALTDYAHDLGLKFGLWVEPERVSREIVGQPGLAHEAWLATSAGDYKSPDTAQICFASQAGRDWVFSQLTKLIDDVQPDYLKWDNNFWINCTRDGHGHGPKDGNFAHVTGLYSVLATLRARYPQLLIENVSGGGNRLDFGMLRYTDVAWMDDRTAPSLHVRHNLEGLSTMLPTPYLLSFAVDHADEPLHNAPDLALYLRSRMQGALGLSVRDDQLSQADTTGLAGHIAAYKNVRGMISAAAALLLTPQVSANARGGGWDIIETWRPSDSAAIIWAFQTDPGSRSINVKPHDLNPATVYDVCSADRGKLGAATGAELMANGIDILESPISAAHLLTLTPKGS
jgi:alpha-galactosidase